MRRLIIDGNAVYEIDEKCMLKKAVKKGDEGKKTDQKHSKHTEKR